MPDESTEIIPAVPYSPPPFAGLREPPSRPPQPADFTREARIASRGRMFDSYAACYPHFAPVEFTRKADGSLEFPDRQPSALRRATDAALSSLLEDWESQARAAVRSTYRTALSPAWSPPVSTGAVRLSPAQPGRPRGGRHCPVRGPDRPS